MDPIQLQTYHSAIPNLPRVLMVLKHFRGEKRGFLVGFVCVFYIFCGGWGTWNGIWGGGSKCMVCFMQVKMKTVQQSRELEYKLIDP